MSGVSDFSGKSRAELDVLLANVERVLADPKRAAQHRQATAMREEAQRARGALPVAPGRRATAGGTATDTAIALLCKLAKTLPSEFDLSPPPGTRQAHKLTAGDGSPKVGGRQRNREVASDRYLSYKRGDRIAMLGWLRRHDEDAATGGGWYVRSGGVPEDTPYRDDPDGAAAAFRAELEELAPALGG